MSRYLQRNTTGNQFFIAELIHFWKYSVNRFLVGKDIKDILLLLHNNVYFHVLNPSPSIKLGESVWGQRSLRPSGDQYRPADGLYFPSLPTPLTELGREGKGAVSWMTDCCSKVKGTNLWHFTSPPVSISLQPRPPSCGTCTCVLHPAVDSSTSDIRSCLAKTHTRIIQPFLAITWVPFLISILLTSICNVWEGWGVHYLSWPLQHHKMHMLLRLFHLLCSLFWALKCVEGHWECCTVPGPLLSSVPVYNDGHGPRCSVHRTHLSWGLLQQSCGCQGSQRLDWESNSY